VKKSTQYERIYFKDTAHQSDLPGSCEILLSKAGLVPFSLHLLAQITTQELLSKGRYYRALSDACLQLYQLGKVMDTYQVLHLLF
jgi:hypothetical protein